MSVRMCDARVIMNVCVCGLQCVCVCVWCACLNACVVVRVCGCLCEPIVCLSACVSVCMIGSSNRSTNILTDNRSAISGC